MPNRTDHVPHQHPRGLPEPSYARRVLDQIAALIETASPDRLVYALGLRRVFTIAVATELHGLPTNVADEVAGRVDKLLPDAGPDSTCGPYAQQLRQIAAGV